MKRSIIITVFCTCVAFLFWQCNKESVVEKVEYQRGNIVHYGSGAPSSTIGEIGDYYFDLSVSDLYGAKTESGWGDPVSLKGDRGERGEQGEQGEKGEKGEAGDKGEKGDKGAQGDKGLIGDKGEQGNKGLKGDDGKKNNGDNGAPVTQIHLGKGEPSSYIGKEGDWYIDTETGVLYGPKKYSYYWKFATGPDFEVSKDGTTLYRCNKKDITEVNFEAIPKLKNVTKIGRNVFQGCHSLTSVTISNKVTSIEENAFSYCESLKSIVIPNGVTSIGSSAFSGCTSLVSITIPNGVTSIEDNTFSGCKSLKSVTIPNSVTSIKSSVFAVCTSLESIIIPNNVKTIESNAFSYSGIKEITLYSIPYTRGNDSFLEYIGKLEVVKLGMKNVSKFKDRKYIKNLVFLDTVETIEKEAFYEEDNYNNPLPLTSVVIGNGVKSIGESAFSCCRNLSSVTIGNKVTKIGDQAFVLARITSIIIPDNVTDIGSQAFYGSHLQSVVIGSGIKHWSSAFSDCEKLTSVTIKEGVTHISSAAFYDCKSLTSITIPSSVTKIERKAFLKYEKYPKITVTFKGTTPPIIEEGNFEYWEAELIDGKLINRYSSHIEKIYVPAESLERYKEAYSDRRAYGNIYGWSYFIEAAP